MCQLGGEDGHITHFLHNTPSKHHCHIHVPSRKDGDVLPTLPLMFEMQLYLQISEPLEFLKILKYIEENIDCVTIDIDALYMLHKYVFSNEG